MVALRTRSRHCSWTASPPSRSTRPSWTMVALTLSWNTYAGGMIGFAAFAFREFFARRREAETFDARRSLTTRSRSTITGLVANPDALMSGCVSARRTIVLWIVS